MTRRIQRLTRGRLDSRIPHVRFNWETKPRDVTDLRQLDASHTVRFNFVVLAKDPRPTADKITALIRQYDGGLELPVNFMSGTLKKGFRYLLRSVEANVRPDEIDFSRYGLAMKRDSNLRGDNKTLIDYVVKTYSP